MIFNKIPSVLLFLMSLSCSVFAQGGDDNRWLGSQSKEILKSMGVTLQAPQGFRLHETFGLECFEGTQKLADAFTCVSNRLVSEDAECVVFMPIRRILTEEDSVRINGMFKGSLKSLNNIHNNQLKHQLKDLLGDQTAANWKEAVTYYSEEETKSKFNADTAMYYSIKLEDDQVYNEKYNNLYSLFLQKKDRSFINIIVFYTDKIKGDFDVRLAQIENMIRYGDSRGPKFRGGTITVTLDSNRRWIGEGRSGEEGQSAEDAHDDVAAN